MTITKAPPLEKLCAYLGCEPANFDDAYRLLRRKVMKFFDWKRCQETPELADETIARVLEAIDRERDIRDFNNFVLGIARNVFADWTRGQVTVDGLRRALEIDFDPEWLPQESSDEAVCLERCLRMLPPDKRELLEACFVDKRRKELGRALQLSKNAMRMRIYHSKQRLRSCVGACLKAPNTR